MIKLILIGSILFFLGISATFIEALQKKIYFYVIISELILAICYLLATNWWYLYLLCSTFAGFVTGNIIIKRWNYER